MDLDAAVEQIDQALAGPLVDVDDLPAIPVGYTIADETAVSHLCRAILKSEASQERLKAAMAKEMEAWAHMLAAQQAKTESWRAIVQDFLKRKELKSIKTPWFTAFQQKGRRHLDWKPEDEEKVVAALKELKAEEALKVETTVKKKEFSVIFDSVPDKFKGLVEDTVGDPVLVIKEAK